MDFSEYLSIPYLPDGRDRAGCDCWGLVRLVLIERFGKVVPSYTGMGAEEAARIESCNYEQIPEPEPGDIVLIRRHGIPAHAGVYIGDWKVLHSDSASGPCIECLDSPRIRGRVEGFYRA
jgi:cell wall-associated NlpC family hydrolase